MKLARIEHERCGEYSGYLHVVIPDDWDYDKLKNIVNKCVNEHIESAKLYAANSKAPNNWQPYGVKYNEFPLDYTIKQAHAEWARMGEEYKEWQKTLEPAKKTFSERLSDNGIRMLYNLQGGYMDDPADGDEILEASASWGHNHGLGFRYEEDKFQDALPPGKKMSDYHS